MTETRETPAFPVWRWIPFFLIIGLPFSSAIVGAQTAEIDTTISAEDKAQFDQMLTPVTKVYNFIKYTTSVIGLFFMLFAGIGYMMSGNDTLKREQSKSMATYVVFGLVVIWAAPYAVNLLVA